MGVGACTLASFTPCRLYNCTATQHIRLLSANFLHLYMDLHPDIGSRWPRNRRILRLPYMEIYAKRFTTLDSTPTQICSKIVDILGFTRLEICPRSVATLELTPIQLSPRRFHTLDLIRSQIRLGRIHALDLARIQIFYL